MCFDLRNAINAMEEDMPQAEPSLTDRDLNRAIQHAVNYHGLDTRLNMADYAIADLITDEVHKHLNGLTDVQIYERMTPEERAKIGERP